ncbi:putative membrane protein [Mycobacterium antarcticum]|uniref:LapA family protein n=1 Tax=unclassified Mycolicibacterium TaxID=2636767 RepID=UPI0023A27702|nr:MULTISPECIES: lipopolysaccharide assembly LapA domain-containing protein [unclassified Mycolicibacterium]BDX29819.1 putative membrane protein [Mycolicibacterium sp. TUM20985]GLP73244.1 putative membrane protein [Mycolicibacterium sp. TUM20983]
MSTDPQFSPADSSRPGPLDPRVPEPSVVDTSVPSPPPENAVHFTRAAALWSALIVGFLVLIVLLIFIAQNTDPGTFHFLGWSWSLPLGVALLAAAVLGGLITTLAGVVRIVQLRRAAKKNYKAALR